KYLFTEGVVFGYLKRIEESQCNFKELIKIDPKNDLYKNWYESNKIKIIYKQSSIVGYTGCGFFILKIFIEVIYNIKLSPYIDLVSCIIMILGFSFPYIVKEFNKIKW